MSSLPPLNAVRAFVVAAEYGSFKKAAEKLSVTPGAISHHIQNLERFFGISLFKRSYRAIQLSAEGSYYFTQLKALFFQLHKASDELLSPSPQAPIVMDCSLTFMMHWFLTRLSSFQQHYPDIDVSTRCDMNVLNPDSFDYAIRRHPYHLPGFKTTELMTEYCAPVCSPSLKNLEYLQQPTDIARFKTIHIRYREDLWPHWANTAGFELPLFKDKLVVDHTFIAIQAVQDGLGIAVLPLLFLEHQLKNRHLILPLGHSTLPSATYYLVQSLREKRSELQIFHEWLIEMAAPFSSHPPSFI